MNKVGVIGTHGVPAKYGGFETLAENFAFQLGEKLNITVYCNKLIYKKRERVKSNLKCRRIFIPINASGWQSYLYDLICFLHAAFTCKHVIYLGPTSGYLLLLNKIFRRNIITNYGGLNEWERPKYNFFQKSLIKINFFLATRFSNHNIVDNEVLKKSLYEVYKAESKVIRYGGDHVLDFCSQIITNDVIKKFPFVIAKYKLAIARAQKDSKFELLIEAQKKSKCQIPLVIVSNWDVCEYGRKIKSSNYEKVILLDAIYDKKILNTLRSNCSLYIHSHSFCGTAPSLVEAMFINKPIICYDVETNREVTEGKTIYFKSTEQLIEIFDKYLDKDLSQISRDLNRIANNSLKWKIISKQYYDLIIPNNKND